VSFRMFLLVSIQYTNMPSFVKIRQNCRKSSYLKNVSQKFEPVGG